MKTATTRLCDTRIAFCGWERAMKLRSIVLCLLLGLFVASESSAAVVTLAPEADARMLAITDDRRPEFLSVYTDGNNIQRSLIRFDLTGIPAGQTITSASLTLFTNIGFGSNPNNLPMDIFRALLGDV